MTNARKCRKREMFCRLFLWIECKVSVLVREAAKSYFLKCHKGGGGVFGGKDLAIKKTFFGTLFLFVTILNKKYFTLDNLSTYRYFTVKFVGRYFYWFVIIFPPKKGLFDYLMGLPLKKTFFCGFPKKVVITTENIFAHL